MTWRAAPRIASWTAPAVGIAWLPLTDLTSPEAAPNGLLITILGLLFVLLVVRVLIAAVRSPSRRVPLLGLAVGLVLWAAGSAVLNSSPESAAVAFPAPGEWLFLASYLGFSAYLTLDRKGASPASSGWLDALIVVGGAGCLALAALLLPFAHAGDGVALLVALLYPLLDVILLLLVVAQVALRQRRLDIGAGMLGAAFVVLATADASLVASAMSGTYAYGELLDLAWCLGFLLLVDAACRPSEKVTPEAGVGRAPVAPIVGAAAVALTTLLLQQSGGVRLLVDVPAVMTLLAVGSRLVLALRQSHQVNEALKLARTDDLTGLPNRRELDRQLARHDGVPGPVSLLLLDLDGFKEINDTLGHSAGDNTLCAIATRLKAAAPSGSLTVRLGGDEFAVLVTDDDPITLSEHALQLRDAIRKPIRVDGLEVCLDVSIGISLREQGRVTVTDLLRQADVAMYQAKASRAGALIYDAARDDFSRERLRIAEELRRGIDQGEIVVWYQPKVDAVTGHPKGAEALVRWSHPTDGLLSPAVFLPAARRTGLMPALTRAVLAQVVQDASDWRAWGTPVVVAVNVAPAELLAPSVMADLFEMLRSKALGPGSLVIEVTEDSFLAEPDHAREVIEAIGREGQEVSIDDYGTGYSSLSYLRDLPIAELKIDRSFVADILTNPRDEMIVRTTTQLGKGLGLRTVAEGVEDAGTAERLRLLGVDVLQGYHIARPMPPAELFDWVTSRSVPALPNL